jgi:8-oxo-dGTP pyrophosphatase MutT (NUDIX family)
MRYGARMTMERDKTSARTTPRVAFDPFLDSTHRLSPGNAVAAILLLEDGRYLLQHRDPKPDIFFPGHWGCFGGAIDSGESDPQALARELREELAFDLDAASLRHFTRLDFDMSFAGCGVVYRSYFELSIHSSILTGLRLGEGCEMRPFTGRDLLRQQVAPSDEFVLWMHVNRLRLHCGALSSP